MTGGHRAAVTALTAAATAVGLIGALHLPFARGALARLGGCPIGRSAKPAVLEPARLASAATERGVSNAPARPALGFVLDRTTYGDVKAWAARTATTCDDVREGLVRCSDVLPGAVGLDARELPLDHVDLGFDVHARLVNIATLRTHVPEPMVGATLASTTAHLREELGPPQGESGVLDEGHLAATGASSLAALRYRFHDYFAEVVAMRLREDGVSVREHFMSVTDGT